MHEMYIHFYEFEGDLSTTHFLHLSRKPNKEKESPIVFTHKIQKNPKRCTWNERRKKDDNDNVDIEQQQKIIEKHFLTFDNSRIEHLNFGQKENERNDKKLKIQTKTTKKDGITTTQRFRFEAKKNSWFNTLVHWKRIHTKISSLIIQMVLQSFLFSIFCILWMFVRSFC